MTRYNELNTLKSEIADLKRRMRITETAPRLSSSSIGIGGLNVSGTGGISIFGGGGVVIGSGGTVKSYDFNGTLPNLVGTTGWALGGSGSSAVFSQLRLRHGILEDGTLEGHSADGGIRIIVGTLPDSTHGVLEVNAPPPPVPAMPSGQTAPHGYVVSWDGRNADGTDVQPLDWSRVEIHSSVITGFEPSSSTLRGTFESPRGGSHVCIAGIEYDPLLSSMYEVLLVARNKSGTASLPSDRITIGVGALEAMDITDFSLTVRKFQSDQHYLY